MPSLVSKMDKLSNKEVWDALTYLHEKAEEAAQARAEKVYLDEFSKHLKASLMQRFAGGGTSLGAQERDALAHRDYLAHLAALKIAVEADAKHQFLRAAAQATVDAWQTMSANQRAVKV
jgi:hypothetical protein